MAGHTSPNTSHLCEVLLKKSIHTSIQLVGVQHVDATISLLKGRATGL